MPRCRMGPLRRARAAPERGSAATTASCAAGAATPTPSIMPEPTTTLRPDLAALAAIPTGPQRAPRGNVRTCRTWAAEAALRMLMNNLDPEVGEDPANLVVYGGSGKAARDWPSFQAIVATLRRLAPDETLLVQSGRPVGVFKTQLSAPRVLIANSNLVGRLVVSAGLGGMGGAQPLAATMNHATFLAADVDRSRIEKRLRTRYLDVCIDGEDGIDRAIDQALAWKSARVAKSIGVLCTATDLLRRLLARGVVPDVLTDQTSAHDPLHGYVPDRITYAAALELRARDPRQYQAESMRTMKAHCELMIELQRRGADTFDYGNNLRGHAKEAGLSNAFDFEGFVPKYIRPLFCEGQGPFRWAALSGDPRDIAVTDRILLELFPQKTALARWIRMAQERVQFQGLPARICWLGLGERARAGLAFNAAVQRGEIRAPLVIGRDHLDCGSVASPNRETEAMRDGTDAVADWPILNALLNVASGASWVSFHHGGGVGS